MDAKELEQRARQLRAKGRFAESADAMREAARLDPGCGAAAWLKAVEMVE